MANYEVIEYEGQPARKYADGSIRDEKGHWLVRSSPAPLFTTENASEMGKRRKQKMLEAVEQGVMDATEMPNPYEAVSLLIKVRAQVALEDKGRAGNEAAKMVLEALDAKPDKQSETVQTQRMEYVIDPETLAMLEKIAQMKRDAE